MAKAPIDLRSLARSHTEMALRVLCGIAQNGENEGARVAACGHILDRGWGKAPQAITGADGEGDIRVTIRHILEGGQRVGEQRVVNQGTLTRQLTNGERHEP